MRLVLAAGQHHGRDAVEAALVGAAQRELAGL
jgi:hypothetical protein